MTSHYCTGLEHWDFCPLWCVCPTTWISPRYWRYRFLLTLYSCQTLPSAPSFLFFWWRGGGRTFKLIWPATNWLAGEGTQQYFLPRLTLDLVFPFWCQGSFFCLSYCLPVIVLALSLGLQKSYLPLSALRIMMIINIMIILIIVVRE